MVKNMHIDFHNLESSSILKLCISLQCTQEGNLIYFSPNLKKWLLLFDLFLCSIHKLQFLCIKIYFLGISEWGLTYDIWSFVLLIAEPFLRPLASLSFYFKYLYSDPLTDVY